MAKYLTNLEISSLLVNYQNGKTNGNELAEAFYKICRRVLSKYKNLSAYDDVDDIVQSTVCLMFKVSKNIDPTKNPFSYLTSVAINNMFLCYSKSVRRKHLLMDIMNSSPLKELVHRDIRNGHFQELMDFEALHKKAITKKRKCKLRRKGDQE